MPPKVDSAAKTPSTNESFLATCIKHAKDKITVDYDAVAKELGMSKGGACNKFRFIMKQFEDEKAAGGATSNASAIKGNANAKKPTATRGTKRRTKTTTARKGGSVTTTTTASKARIKAFDNNHDSGNDTDGMNDTVTSDLTTDNTDKDSEPEETPLKKRKRGGTTKAKKTSTARTAPTKIATKRGKKAKEAQEEDHGESSASVEGDEDEDTLIATIKNEEEFNGSQDEEIV